MNTQLLLLASEEATGSGISIRVLVWILIFVFLIVAVMVVRYRKQDPGSLNKENWWSLVLAFVVGWISCVLVYGVSFNPFNARATSEKEKKEEPKDQPKPSDPIQVLEPADRYMEVDWGKNQVRRVKLPPTGWRAAFSLGQDVNGKRVGALAESFPSTANSLILFLDPDKALKPDAEPSCQVTVNRP